MHRSSSALALAAALLLPAAAFAKKSKEVDPEDHENHFGEVEPVTVDDVSIKFEDQHAQMEFILVKGEVKNDADRYLFIEPRESKWVIDGKAEDADSSKPKHVLIEPFKDKTITWKVSGDIDEGADYHVRACQLQLEGFFTATNDSKPLAADDFQIPASANKFKAGGFECSLDNLKNDTHFTKATFTCTYKGEHVGFVDSSLAGWKIPAGQTFANEEKGGKKVMVQRGEKTKFTVSADIDSGIFDMEEDGIWHLIWNDTFSESEKKALKMPTVSFELDVAKTEAENS